MASLFNMRGTTKLSVKAFDVEMMAGSPCLQDVSLQQLSSAYELRVRGVDLIATFDWRWDCGFLGGSGAGELSLTGKKI